MKLDLFKDVFFSTYVMQIGPNANRMLHWKNGWSI